MPSDPSSHQTTADDADLQSCEACDARGPADAFTLMADCWHCADCTAKWRAEFAACKHEWVSATNDFGADAAYCTRCAGLVDLEDFPAMGFDPAALSEPAP